MDLNAFASLAQFRILLLPVGSIHQSTFEKYAAEIRSFEELRFSDIPGEMKDEKDRFMPKQLQAGHVHLAFASHPPPESHAPLALFRPSHFPLAVVGIAASSSSEPLSHILEEFNGMLDNMFPARSTFPMAKNCFVYEQSESSTNLSLGESPPGLVVIPGIMGNKKIYVGTLLADLCSQVLREFGQLAETLESPLGNEYLNGALFPVLPSSSEFPDPVDHTLTKSKSLPPLNSHNSQPDLPTLNAAQHAKAIAGASIKRTSSTGPSSPSRSAFRQSTLGAPSANKKRNSTIGAASSHGRLFKVTGDLFLLAGRTEDAIIWYTEAIALLKSPQDTIWNASALEGMATVSVLDGWSAGQAGQGLNSSAGTGKEPWADVLDRLNQAIPLYYKASPISEEHAMGDYSLLAYIYTSCVLRQASLLFSVWSAKGWGPLAFTTMLLAGSNALPPTLSHDSTLIDRERLTTVTGISRVSIAATIAQAHGPWLLHLEPGDRLSMLERMASLYACLGYKRKEAYVLREVLGCVMDLLVCAREEDDARKPNGAVPNGSVGTTLAVAGGRGAVAMRQNESAEGNESVLRLLRHVCRVLGINLDAVRLVPVQDAQAVEDAVETEEEAQEAPHEPYGWPELQVGVVREALAVAEALPDYPSVAQFALSSLKTLHPMLAPGDQFHLYGTSARALTTARRRGDPKSVEYWSGRPVVSIAVVPLPFIRLPIEKPLSALKPHASDVTPILKGGTDPFLYNPRKLLAAQGQSLLVQNELVELVVTLRNPFVFDLELQSLALRTTGVPFDSKPTAVVIPANSVHPVAITGTALEPGTLTIRGCIVQAPGGAPREFTLPLSTDDAEEARARERSALECETSRIKYSGLESFPWEKAQLQKRASVPAKGKKAVKYLECKVVAEQPFLRIRRTSLTHGAVMLYNGEMSTIRLTLENISWLPIDFLRLAFDDSTMQPAQEALAEGEMSVFDTYETEYDLIRRPVFAWHGQNEFKNVPAGGKVNVTVQCFGKVGCTSGTIHISYSSVHRPQPELQAAPADVFHARQLSYPVLVTVYHMLECSDMDILPYADVHGGMLGAAEDEADYCLFTVDVRNTYGIPFEVVFERTQNETKPASASAVVPPGSTSRIVLPLKKFLLPTDQSSSPIPTLSDRQFVVAKDKLGVEEEHAQRELFWYREELFKAVGGRWREAGGPRAGELSLRQQRLSMRMLEVLRTETARVRMELVEYPEDSGAGDMEARAVRRRDGKFVPKANGFVHLRTTVMNLTPSPLTLTLTLHPPPQTAAYILTSGVLSAIPLGRVEPGERALAETALCFLARGGFDVRAEVFGVARGRVGEGVCRVVVEEEV